MTIERRDLFALINAAARGIPTFRPSSNQIATDERAGIDLREADLIAERIERDGILSPMEKSALSGALALPETQLSGAARRRLQGLSETPVKVPPATLNQLR